MPAQDNFIVSLDIGSSSVRSLLFDGEGNHRPGFGEQLTYELRKTSDGGVEADAEELSTLAIGCLDRIHAQLQEAGLRAAGVAASAFWHCFLGTGESGVPTTPILHLFDTRAAAQTKALAKRLDAHAVHQRTGCRFHSSYWPAKLLWLEENRPKEFRATRRWMSFPEYLFGKLTGEPACSVSMASASGLWNLRENDYDAEVLGALPIERSQLWPVERMDEAQTKLLSPYAARWPLFDGVAWHPAYGDGACSNIGSGCVTPDEFCLMVGTSGALRAVTGAVPAEIPEGLWCYRADRRRAILGGALTNGGDVYAWMCRNLALPGAAATEAELETRATGLHGLTVLPYFGGERSPYWRADLRGAMIGLSLATSPMDILQASLEAVALSFRRIFDLMLPALGSPRRVVASGGALLHSRAWTQMMADALGIPVLLAAEKEASARGAALLALDRPPAAPEGAEFDPRPESAATFAVLKQAGDSALNRVFPQS